MQTSWLRGVLAGLGVFVPLFAAAQQPFEVALAGVESPLACLITSFTTPAVEWINPDHLDEVDIQSIASADGRRIFGITTRSEIVILTPDGGQTPFFPGFPGSFADSLAIAPDGRVFAAISGPGSARRLAVISASGALETTYPFTGSDIAVGPDGCTIYYLATGRVGRFNGCTGAPMPDFLTLPGQIEDVTPLSDGQVLVATPGEVLLASASGVVVRTVANRVSYGFNAETSFEEVAALGDVLWIAAADFCADQSFLIRASLASGAELSRRTRSLDFVSALVIGAAVEEIPAASEWALLALALAMATAGALLLRLR